MKKLTAAALALTSLTLVASPAMALQPATRGVLVAGAPAGNATSTFAGTSPPSMQFPFGGCIHALIWNSPAGLGGGAAFCELVEENTFGSFCSPGANVNIPVRAGDGFSPICQGYLPGGVTGVPVVLALQEFPGNPALSGTGFFDGIVFPLTVTMF